MLFALKRKAYLSMKKLVNRFPLLKKLNRARRIKQGERERAAVVEKGLPTAVAAVDALEKCGFEPILTFGTLLGAIRDHNLINGDNDIDIGIIVNYGDNSVWQGVKSALEEAGFSIARQYSIQGNITEQAYSAEGFYFDVWGLCRQEGNDCLRAFYHCQIDEGDYHSAHDRSIKYIDLPDFSLRKTVPVGDYELPVPVNAEEMVECVYGPNWRIPDPDFISGTGWTLMEGVVETYQVFC